VEEGQARRPYHNGAQAGTSLAGATPGVPPQDLPPTHDLRIVRAIMLKGAALQNLEYDAIALVALMLLAMTIAVTRFRRTLD
jgi:hypothetical protein